MTCDNAWDGRETPEVREKDVGEGEKEEKINLENPAPTPGFLEPRHRSRNQACWVRGTKRAGFEKPRREFVEPKPWVQWNPRRLDFKEEARVSSPNSTISSVSGKRSERDGGEEHKIDRASSRSINDQEDGDTSRKKLWVSKDLGFVLNLVVQSNEFFPY
ncbi:hypothetical protein SLEP1_g54825 [Rubroshorea leprosula]|uniref:HD-ZIP protein N-terminal domain-containing protein n=1 Tax=Rubroshorea leprosula TaxID=152421 RepID=A0AAV5MHB9_9ROSI|nr:hypothetical protein SLEP1_g54825 [Rubroshorea leprosula]